ncbi:MAG: protein phosphatase 2C domain-containing protein [Myxococcota bacterium]
MRTRFAGKSDVGLLRDRNEDSYLVFPQYRFAAVADGMGGHLSGDVASSLAISTLVEFYRNTVGPDRTWPFPYDNDLTAEENCVVVGVRLANQSVFGRARSSQNESGMGTTIVAVMFTPEQDQVIVGHVGDSRCYRLREGQITQLTSDHSLVSEVTEIAPWLSEEEVSQLPSNVITRALGMGPDVVVDLLTTETRPDDTYLLCSDGLNGMLSDEEILAIHGDHGDDLERFCGTLIRRANAAGGNDNTTVVAVHVDDAPPTGDTDGPTAGGAIELIEGSEAFRVAAEPEADDGLSLDLRPTAEDAPASNAEDVDTAAGDLDGDDDTIADDPAVHDDPDEIPRRDDDRDDEGTDAAGGAGEDDATGDDEPGGALDEHGADEMGGGADDDEDEDDTDPADGGDDTPPDGPVASSREDNASADPDNTLADEDTVEADPDEDASR